MIRQCPLEEFKKELEKIMENVCDFDQYALFDLMSHTLWQWYRDRYDSDYKLPF